MVCSGETIAYFSDGITIRETRDKGLVVQTTSEFPRDICSHGDLLCCQQLNGSKSHIVVVVVVDIVNCMENPVV